MIRFRSGNSCAPWPTGEAASRPPIGVCGRHHALIRATDWSNRFRRWSSIATSRERSRIATLLELARENGLRLPATNSRCVRRVQILPHDPLTWENFLSKFDALRHFFRSPEVIARLVREAIEDLAADRIVYAELRFTPAALAASRATVSMKSWTGCSRPVGPPCRRPAPAWDGSPASTGTSR